LGSRMKRDFRSGISEEEERVEIDIRKILEQMGLEKHRWPKEWFDTIDPSMAKS